MRSTSAVMGLTALLAAVTPAQDAGPARPSLLKASFAKLPIYFIENQGVYPDKVAYYVQGADKTLFFTRDGITFRLRGKERGWVVKLEFVGANPDVRPRGEDQREAHFSYFKGPEKQWKTGLGTYGRVVYEDLWPGIDLVYRGVVNRLKYEFVVKPGMDPGRIRLRYLGATEVEVTETGGLRVETPAGNFEDEQPVAWQEIDGERAPVGMAYSLVGNGTDYAFHLGAYDATKPLVLDPAILLYCGYIGGKASDQGYGIAVDRSGNTYLTGQTSSDQHTFPVRVGPSLTYDGGGDTFVAKVNAQGTGLVYCGYIGGTGWDSGTAIAVDATGNAYVVGSTDSAEATFPVKRGPDLTHNGGGDAYVAKVNAQGTGLVYCGYLGGAGLDGGTGIAVDAAGNAYVTGGTASDEQTFPVKTGPDLTYNGGNYWGGDAFVAKVKPDGTGLVYCGYVGGGSDDYGFGIAVDAAGEAYVTGYTESDQQTFPVTVGPDLTHNGGWDAYVAKVNAQGTALVYCGYLGGAKDEVAEGIALDRQGNPVLVGYTKSDEQTFPVRVGPDLTYNGHPDDAFVAKVNSSGTGLVYCGYIGGATRDEGMSIALDMAGNAYVTGWTWSDERTFPVKVGPDLTRNDTWILGDVFVAKVNPRGSGLVYCGYIGGAGRDYPRGIAVDQSGNAYVTGTTASDERTFPVKAGPGLTPGGGGDAFVAKVVLLDDLTATGTPRPGGVITLNLSTVEVWGVPYQLGTSLGTGPIPIDMRTLNLSPDNLLLVSASDLWPWIFQGYRGMIDSRGKARAAIHIPNITALIGVRLHSAFVTLDPAAPSGVRSISNTFSFSITK